MHVGISQTLLNAVRDKIRNELRPKDYKLNFGVDNVAKTFVIPSDHPAVTQVIWGDHLHLQSQMPPDWLETLSWTYEDKAYLKLRATTKDKEIQDMSSNAVDISVILNKKREIKLPPNCSNYTQFKVAYDICPEIKEFFDKRIEEMKFERKWLKVASDVRAFLESNKSLNAAINAWPELRAFIPAEYLERVDKKCERKVAREQAERKLAEIDREGAVAAATLAALAA